MTHIRIGTPPSVSPSQSSPVPDSAPPPAGAAPDDFGRVASAEVNARFQRTSAKIPELLADWRAATVEAAIEEAARNTFWPQVVQAIEAAEQLKGDGLTRREARGIIATFEAQYMASATRAVAPAIEKDRDQAIASSVHAYRSIVAQKKDPFTPIAIGDPAARAKETVLWENSRVMVIVDSFSPKPKALVVPKAALQFPLDASKSQLAELAKIAAETSAAFAQVMGCKESEVWINPPQYLTVKQLHVHVGPPVADWDESVDPQTLARQQSGVWAAMSAVLGQRLRYQP